MAYFTADQSPFATQGSALYPSGTTGTIAGGNVSTVFSIALGTLFASGATSTQLQPALFDAKSATIVINNNATAQTITAASLQFTDTVGGANPTITYALPQTSIASNGTQTFIVQLNSGVLKTANLSITFGSAPTAGSVAVQAVFHGSGDPVGNMDNIALIASAAFTTTQTVADQTNYNARGVVVVLNVTSAGTGSVTLEIDGKDPVSSSYYAILTGAAVTTNSTNVYTVYPGNTVTANVSASQPLPRTWRVKVTANNANSVTYSVGCMLIV